MGPLSSTKAASKTPTKLRGTQPQRIHQEEEEKGKEKEKKIIEPQDNPRTQTRILEVEGDRQVLLHLRGHGEKVVLGRGASRRIQGAHPARTHVSYPDLGRDAAPFKNVENADSVRTVPGWCRWVKPKIRSARVSSGV